MPPTSPSKEEEISSKAPPVEAGDDSLSAVTSVSPPPTNSPPGEPLSSEPSQPAPAVPSEGPEAAKPQPEDILTSISAPSAAVGPPAAQSHPTPAPADSDVASSNDPQQSDETTGKPDAPMDAVAEQNIVEPPEQSSIPAPDTPTPLTGRKRKLPDPREEDEETEKTAPDLSIQIHSRDSTPAARSRTSSVMSTTPQSLPPSPVVPSPYLQPMASASSEITAALLDPVATIKLEHSLRPQQHQQQSHHHHHHALAASPQSQHHAISPALVPVADTSSFSSAAAALAAVPFSALPTPNLNSPAGSASPEPSASPRAPAAGVSPAAPKPAPPELQELSLGAPMESPKENQPARKRQRTVFSSVETFPAAEKDPKIAAVEEEAKPRPPNKSPEAGSDTPAEISPKAVPPQQQQSVQAQADSAVKKESEAPKLEADEGSMVDDRDSSPKPAVLSSSSEPRREEEETSAKSDGGSPAPKRARRAAAIVAAVNIKRSESTVVAEESSSTPTSSSSASPDVPEPPSGEPQSSRREGSAQAVRGSRGRRGRGGAGRGRGRGSSRRGRGGRGGSGGGSRPQQEEMESSSSSSSDTDNRGEEEEEDSSVTRCVCGDNDDNDGFMICCERCEVWQHGECVNVNPKNVPDKYYCELCEPKHPIHLERRRLESEIARARQLHEQQKAVSTSGRGGRRSGGQQRTPGGTPRKDAETALGTAGKDPKESPPSGNTKESFDRGSSSNSSSARKSSGERKRKRSPTPKQAPGTPDVQRQSMDRLQRARDRELRLQRQAERLKGSSSGDSGSESGETKNRRKQRSGRSSRDPPMWAGNSSVYHTKLRLPAGPSEEERRQAQLDLAFELRRLHPLAPMYFGRKHFVLGPPSTTTATAMRTAKQTISSSSEPSVVASSGESSSSSATTATSRPVSRQLDWRNYREQSPEYLRSLAKDTTLPFSRRICLSYFAEQMESGSEKLSPKLDTPKPSQPASAQAPHPTQPTVAPK